MRGVAVTLGLLLAGCAATPDVVVPTTAPPPISKAEDPAPPMGQQWLYGSAEGSVASLQTYKAIRAYVRLRLEDSTPWRQVILADGSMTTAPKFDDCGKKPLAAVFDADETLIWNLGAMRYMAERGKSFDAAIWDQWEKTGAGKAIAMPGAIDALKEMRSRGLTIVINTNRSAANAKGTEETLRAAGLGEFKHGETLFLMGDTPDGASKDGRRALIAGRYCVIAMAGDQLGDFAQSLNAPGMTPADRRSMAMARFHHLWGYGWFLFSNPVYGPSIRGSFDDIFPSDKQWEPSQ